MSPTPEPGMGAAICYPSDRHPATIRSVGHDRSGKVRSVTVTEDRIARGLFVPDDGGDVRIFTLRRNGRWHEVGKRAGKSAYLHIGKRIDYRSPEL